MAEQPGRARAGDRPAGPPPRSLAELARPYRDAAELIVDLTPGPGPGPALDDGDPGSGGIRRWRATPAMWQQATAGGAARPGEIPQLPAGPALLVLLAAGPDPARQLSWEACEQVLGALPDGAHALLLLASPVTSLPAGRVLSLLTGQDCLILEAASLSEPRLPTALALARTAGSPALPELNEYLLATVALQGLQARVAELEQAAAAASTSGAASGGDVPGGSPASGGPAGLRHDGQDGQDGPAERDRLARALRSTQRELVAAYTELAMLESSATVAAGRAMVSVARNPLRGSARLPRELYRLWRERRGRARAAATGALVAAQDRGGAGIGDRWLSAYTAPGYPGPGGDAEGGLVIAGVLTAAGCATLEPDAVAHPLLPHNADFVLEGTGADLVLIQASALLPGSAWAYAADPAAADRGRRLAGLVALARSLGKPVVLLRDAPWSPAASLDWLAAGCDAVLDGDLGVQLARFNPIGLASGRPGEPVYAGARDPREPPALRQVLDELGPEGRGLLSVTGHIPWRAAPELYRSHAVFLAATAAQAREQLAAGARVIAPPGEPAPAGGCASAPDAARAAGELKRARDAGSPELAELVPVLREIFTGHATPVRLAELAGLAGLASRPLPGRQLAVLAVLADPAEAAPLAGGLLAQRLPPAEVVVSLPGRLPSADEQARAERTVTSALRPVAATGAAVRVTATAGLAAAAAAARSPWAVPWAPGYGLLPDYLLDLACARECGRADAVGWGEGTGFGFSPISRPALARRELLLPGAPSPASWPARGLRTLSLTSGWTGA